MTDDNKNLKKYRIEWRQQLPSGAALLNSVFAYFEHDHDAVRIANALELVGEGYQAKAVLLNEDATAAVVALGVRAALDDVAKGFMPEGWQHKELSVRRTDIKTEFSIRTLVSRDLGTIEGELLKRFKAIHDIGCSESDGMPEDKDKWPNKDGMHEWVCILELRSPQVMSADLPDSVTVQWALFWTEGQDSAFEEATGKGLNEATDEEAIAYGATDNAFLVLLCDELGGSDFENHCELCNDRVKMIGKAQTSRLE